MLQVGVYGVLGSPQYVQTYTYRKQNHNSDNASLARICGFGVEDLDPT